VDCKKLFATHLNANLACLRERRVALAAQPHLVAEVLADGAARAQTIARETLSQVKESMGLL
jgi:tryptophanyl-tRNA synthetase